MFFARLPHLHFKLLQSVRFCSHNQPLQNVRKGFVIPASTFSQTKLDNNMEVEQDNLENLTKEELCEIIRKLKSPDGEKSVNKRRRSDNYVREGKKEKNNDDSSFVKEAPKPKCT